MRLFFAVATLIVTLVLAGTVSARTSIGPRFGDWQTARHTLLDSTFSCQAIQCTSGDCARKRYFLIFATSNRDTVVPEFNSGVKVPPGTRVTVTIGNKSYSLTSSSEKSDKFFYPADGRTRQSIIAHLKALDSSSGNKRFFVTDTFGQKQSFSARGIRKVFKELNKKCGTTIP